MSGKEVRVLWKNIMCYKRKEFPNICLLAEIMLCLSGSNSAVERGFSILTMMLSDRRLKTSHELMNYRIIIKINNKNWSDKERSEILLRALEIYMTTKSRRKRKLDKPSLPHDHQSIEIHDSKGEESDSSHYSDCDVYDLSDNDSYNEHSDEDELM